MTTTTQTRYALARIPVSVAERYLPANYRAEEISENVVLISGHDNAGWTLDDYVIPRLASGLYIARELRVEDCEGRLQGQPHPTHVWTYYDGNDVACEAPMFEVVAESLVDARPVCEICGDPTTDKDSHGTLMCLDCQEDEVQHEDCQGYQGGCGSPSCLSCNPPEPCCYTWYRTRHQQHDYDCSNYP